MEEVREEWLRLHSEPAIDPELRICDPHHHLWTHRGRYLREEFLRDAGMGHKIVASVFVACDAMYRKDGPPELRPVGETEFVEAIAEESAALDRGSTRVAEGIVGFADLTLGADVARVLEAHLEASPTRFRGIRHSATWDPSPQVRNAAPNPRPGLLLDATFRAGFACLEKYGLNYDAWLFHPQLPDLAALAKAFPGVPIVVNHLGGPLGTGPYAGKRKEVFEVWRAGIEQLVPYPNVFIKLGGLGMPRYGYGWGERPRPPGSLELAEAAAPYVQFCIEQVGPERCMFESNFPSDKVSYSYGVIWNAFKRIARGYSESERRALFHDIATGVYRLSGATD